MPPFLCLSKQQINKRREGSKMGTIELLCVAVLALNIGGNEDRGKFLCEQMETIVTEAEANNLPPELIIALIHYESRGYPDAVSRSNACGLMQVVPRWTGDKDGGVNKRTGVPKLTCEQLKDPKTNIKYGTMTLKHWISSYGRGSVKIGLCGYNAGYRCKGKNPNKSGTKYSSLVRNKTWKLKRKMEELRSKHKSK